MNAAMKMDFQTTQRLAERMSPSSSEQNATTSSTSPHDSAELSGKSSALRKVGEALIDYPVKAMEFGVCTATGAAYAVKNALPGACEGIHEGLTEYKGSGDRGWFISSTIGESVFTGAVIGFHTGGAVSSALGAFIGLTTGLVLTGIESATGADHKIVETVQKRVDDAVADNTGGTAIQLATRNATEGMMQGVAAGVSTGWKLGRSFGRGLVSGLRGAADGAKEAIFGQSPAGDK